MCISLSRYFCFPNIQRDSLISRMSYLDNFGHVRERHLANKFNPIESRNKAYTESRFRETSLNARLPKRNKLKYDSEWKCTSVWLSPTAKINDSLNDVAQCARGDVTCMHSSFRRTHFPMWKPTDGDFVHKRRFRAFTGQLHFISDKWSLYVRNRLYVHTNENVGLLSETAHPYLCGE